MRQEFTYGKYTMAALVFHVVIILAILSSVLIIPSSSHGVSGLARKHAALYVFGDSLFDPGNNNYINTTFTANYHPYGETFFKYPTGRSSDGRLIPDFIAEYAKLPILPTIYPRINVDYIYGVNFASAGAGALDATRQPGQVIPLNYQVRLFEDVVKDLRHDLGHEETYTLLSNAVYLISIGVNDYMAPLATNCNYFVTHNQEEYVGMVIGNLTNVIKRIHKKGGRKFGLIRMPPMGLFPSQRPGNNSTCVKEATSLQKMHNAALPKHLEKLKRKLKGFKYSLAKLDSYLYERINHPSKYGFKEGKSACCGSGPYGGVDSCGGKRGVPKYRLCDNPKEYVFFDSYHPTERVYQQISELWWNQAPNVKEPDNNNLKSLFEV